MNTDSDNLIHRYDGRPPWLEPVVFMLPDRTDWVYWGVGLDDAGVADVTARVPGAADPQNVAAAVRALDDQVLEDPQAWGAGIWFPAAQGHAAVAGVRVRTFAHPGDRDEAYGDFVRQASTIPTFPGAVVSSYDVGEGEVDLGPFVEQVLDTMDVASGELVLRWRFTFFPEVKDEVVVVEFDTVHAHLVDEIEAEMLPLVEQAFYRVDQEAS